MDAVQQRQMNHAAYQGLKEFIRTTYPTGRFVAIDGGKIIADAATFREVDEIILQMGNHSRNVLVVQAGADNSRKMIILAQEVI